MTVPPLRPGLKKFYYVKDESKQPSWFKKMYYETNPQRNDWMTFEINQEMLERSPKEGKTPKLTQIGRRVKKGMWERVRRGSKDAPI